MDESTLFIPNIRAVHSGQYQCIGDDTNFVTFITEAIVRVKGIYQSI